MTAPTSVVRFPRILLAVYRRRLRELRGEANLSQEAAAERAGLDAKTLQDYERGVTNPTLASLVAIAGAYDVSLSDLFQGV